MKSLLFPKREDKWCVVTNANVPVLVWHPQQVEFKNGKSTIHHSVLIVIPVEPNTEERAIEVAKQYNLQAVK